MTVWYCLRSSLKDFWSVLISKSKPYYFYSRFPSSTFRLARNMKFPVPPLIITPIITAGKHMIKSAHHSFLPSSQMTVFKVKHNLSHRTSSIFPPLVPENSVSWVQGGAGGLSPPSLIYSRISCNMWLILQLKTVLLSQTTGCNVSMSLQKKKKGEADTTEKEA